MLFHSLTVRLKAKLYMATECVSFSATPFIRNILRSNKYFVGLGKAEKRVPLFSRKVFIKTARLDGN